MNPDHAFCVRLIVATLLIFADVAQAESCKPDKYGGLVCGEGGAAMRVIGDTTSPSKRFAFAWRAPDGVPVGTDYPDTGEVRNFLVRLADGEVIQQLGGNYWDNGEAHANRYEVKAIWSRDSAAVLEISDDRWDSYSLRVVLLGAGDKATTVDLREVIEQAVRAKLPKRVRDDQSFQVRWDKKITLDGHGNGRLTAMLYLPKKEPTALFEVTFKIASREGKPVAQIAAMRQVKEK